MDITYDHLIFVKLISRLFFAITADIVVAVGTTAVTAAIVAVFAVGRTIVVLRSSPDFNWMNLRSDLWVVHWIRLCSSAGSRPNVKRVFSFSSPSFFYGYQNRACFYILLLKTSGYRRWG